MSTIVIKQMMADSGVAFGTSGARGLVSQMNDRVCAAYTLAFLAHAAGVETGPIALGMDLRPSSPDIARACAAAIILAGREVDFLGVLPTPALALHALTQGRPAIMITGSHIPFDRNGIKFYRADGEISKADETAIAEAVIELDDAFTPLETLPATNLNALQAYIDRYTRLFSPDLLSGQRIGVYEHSSAARDCLSQVLTALGAEVVAFGRTDTFVPIDTEAVSQEDQQRGLDWAREYQLDAIISTDGDGDRPLLGDEHGVWLRGDLVGLLCAKFLGAETVVAPISCNTAIEASGWFNQVIRTRIGSPFVIAAMQQAQGAVAGFEANGGFLAGSGLGVNGSPLAPLPTRDSLLPALALLALAKQQEQPLSALAAALPQRYTASDRLQNFPTAASAALLQELRAESGRQALWGEELGKLESVNDLDGLRLTFSNGEIVHLRPSGNAPELRCYAEADSQQRAQRLVALTLEKIARTAN